METHMHTQDTMTCPLCGGTHMEYRTITTNTEYPTRAWFCEDCMAVLFEYYVHQNIYDLKALIK